MSVRRMGGFPAFDTEARTGSCERLSIRGRLFEIIRPTGNVLPGYAPSSAANRFKQEAL